MQFNIQTTDLKKVIKAAYSVMASKNMMPILDNVLFRPMPEGWQAVSGTSDIQMVLDTALQLMSGTAEPFCVPAKPLADSVRELPAQLLTIDVDLKAHTLTVTHLNGSFKLNIQAADTYPILDTVGGELTSITLPTDLMVGTLVSGINFCANDEVRLVMTGVCLDLRLESYTFAATNGKKLMRHRTETGVPSPLQGAPMEIIVPLPVISALKNTAAGENITVECNRQKVLFRGDGFSICGPVVEGKYPNYDAVIPKEYEIEAVVQKSDIVSAIKRVRVFANQSSGIIKVSFKEGKMHLEGIDYDYGTSANEFVSVEVAMGADKTDTFRIGVNADYMLQELQLIQSENVRMRMTSHDRPIILREDPNSALTMLVMPMRLNEN